MFAQLHWQEGLVFHDAPWFFSVFWGVFLKFCFGTLALMSFTLHQLEGQNKLLQRQADSVYTSAGCRYKRFWLGMIDRRWLTQFLDCPSCNHKNTWLKSVRLCPVTSLSRSFELDYGLSSTIMSWNGMSASEHWKAVQVWIYQRRWHWWRLQKNWVVHGHAATHFVRADLDLHLGMFIDVPSLQHAVHTSFIFQNIRQNLA